MTVVALVVGVGLFTQRKTFFPPSATGTPAGIMPKAIAATPLQSEVNPAFEHDLADFKSTTFYIRYRRHPVITAVVDGGGQLETSRNLKTLLHFAKTATFGSDGRVTVQVNVSGDPVHRKASAREMARAQLKQIWAALGATMTDEVFERAFIEGDYAPGLIVEKSSFVASVTYPGYMTPPD